MFFFFRNQLPRSGVRIRVYYIYPRFNDVPAIIFAIAYQIFMTCKTGPRTSEDKFLKNGEYLMSKCYLYCIDSRFSVQVLNFQTCLEILEREIYE